MRIVVFGASGGVGREVVAQARAAGHEVTAFVRSPARLSDAEGIRVVTGDAFDAAAVAAAVVGHDAVVSALGSSTGMKPSDEIERMTQNIVAAMTAADVSRIVTCASAGIDGELTGVAGRAIAWMLRHPLADHRAAVARITAAGRAFTIARPTSLTDGPLAADYIEAFTGMPGNGKPIARASVAHFLLKALADPETYVGASVGLAARAR